MLKKEGLQVKLNIILIALMLEKGLIKMYKQSFTLIKK